MNPDHDFITDQKSTARYRFPESGFMEIKQKVLSWINRFGTFCFLDNHFYTSDQHSAEILAAAGIADYVSGEAGSVLSRFQEKTEKHRDWWFGHLAYDLKNETEGMQSSRPDRIGFPDLFFFRPHVVIQLSSSAIDIETRGDPGEIWQHIQASVIPSREPRVRPVPISRRIGKEEYIDIIQRLQQHILRGDCYEINFCQEFYAEGVQIDPLDVYRSLSQVSPNPFSAFYRLEDRYLICASPERYLKKSGARILSQPIKGTSLRYPDDPIKDEASREMLMASAKDRSENVMVVDLVRNDLSRICREASVAVDELFGVYSFPQVHQMISTISGELRPGLGIADIIRASFPMGSMTGAPKRRVMELIEQYEKTRRGIFSGALGYLSPRGDFDFNVVIRSILYNESSKYLSFPAGSGITFYSDPVREYEECLMKAEAIRRVLES